ncbi:expansin-like protein [Gelatoporia subvermispora B]|uniref:Expansin-like protein n=1 Tax=Ceriporiopsis subvermispora (strain B) TaxID=914234 RepID=M2QQU8_CERS8|nr:expansin-like protein [Gelatoporia subvermispora B]
MFVTRSLIVLTLAFSSSVLSISQGHRSVPSFGSKVVRFETPPVDFAALSSTNIPAYLMGTLTGQGTFYQPGLGSCGITNTGADFIVAISSLIFDSFPGYDGVNPTTNPICNMMVTANYAGKSVTVTITDSCGDCEQFELDFSPAAFEQLADQSLGRISGMTWSFV